MHALVLLCINQYTKLEVPSFTYYKDDWVKIKSTGHVTAHAPFRGGLKILALVIPEISLGASKFKVGHVTLTTPFLRAICHPYSGT